MMAATVTNWNVAWAPGAVVLNVQSHAFGSVMKGLSPETARRLADELIAAAAKADAELQAIAPKCDLSPWQRDVVASFFCDDPAAQNVLTESPPCGGYSTRLRP